MDVIQVGTSAICPVKDEEIAMLPHHLPFWFLQNILFVMIQGLYIPSCRQNDVSVSIASVFFCSKWYIASPSHSLIFLSFLPPTTLCICFSLPWTHDPPASVFRILELQVCHHVQLLIHFKCTDFIKDFYPLPVLQLPKSIIFCYVLPALG